MHRKKDAHRFSIKTVLNMLVVFSLLFLFSLCFPLALSTNLPGRWKPSYFRALILYLSKHSRKLDISMESTISDDNVFWLFFCKYLTLLLLTPDVLMLLNAQ